MEYENKTAPELISAILLLENKYQILEESYLKEVAAGKKRDEELQKSEAFLKLSQQIAQIGSWKLDLPTNHLEWSDEIFRIFGCDPQEFEATYEVFLGFVHPDDRTLVDQAYTRSVQERSNGYETKHRIIQKNTGEIRYVVEKCVHEKDAGGIIIRSAGIVQDITEQHKATGEIRSLNEDLQLMNEITNAANSGASFSIIVNIIASHFKATFNTHLVSIFLPDHKTGKLEMFGNALDPELTRKIEQIIRRPIPVVSLDPGAGNPFSEIERTGVAILSIGKKEVIHRLEGYLHGTSWPVAVQKLIKKMLPLIFHILEYRSTAAVAMKFGGEIAGYFEVGSRNTLTHQDLARIQIIADHLASVIARFEAEKKRKESDEKIASAFSYASIGMAFVSPEGKWLRVNPSVQAMLGYTEKEILEKTFQEITHPDDLEKDLDYVKQLLEGTINTYQMEKRYFHKSGNVVWVMLSVSLVHDHEGKPLHFISQIQDITEQKMAEVAVRESEKKFRTLFETMAQGVVYQDTSGMITSANKAAERILGLTLDQLQGRTSIDPRWHSIREDGSVFPGEEHPAMNSLTTGKATTALMGVFNPAEERYQWINVSAIPEFRSGQSEPYQVFTTFDDITELKNTLDELIKSKELLEVKVEERTKEILEVSALQRAILTSAPLAILTSNVEGIIQSINPAGEKMLGYAAGEIVGKVNPLAFHDEDEIYDFCRKTTGNSNPTREEVYITARQNMVQKTTEWTWVRKNGEKFPAKILVSPIFDNNHRLLGFMGLINDITLEKQASDLLRQSEAENRAIIGAVPDLLFRIRRDGTYLDYHSHTDSPLYVPKEIFLGKKLTEILPPDLAAQSMESIEKAFITGDVVQYEYILPIHGKDYYYENRITAISGEEVLSIIRDITHRKESETALKMQSAAFESFALAIIITDINGHIRWSNSAFTRLTGYSNEETKGKTPGELVNSGKHDNAFFENLWNTILGKKVWTGELINRKKDGTLYYEEQAITPVLDSQDRIACFIAIKIDITNRKEAQEELLKAKNEAENANKAKSMFLSRMSHELRTPMNSILGFAQLLKMGDLNQKQRKGVIHILNNGKHLLDLINEVLDLSGIEAGKQNLLKEPIDLSPLIHEVTDSLQGIAARKLVSVIFEGSSPERVVALADRLRLRQILINLIGNAIKYNVEGGTVIVRTDTDAPGDETSRNVKISVTDTGAGIKAEDIGKLFQPFERIGADKSSTEGTGLGLMVVKRLTEAMGGTVGVESVVGWGSTFWFKLPAYQGIKQDSLNDSGSETLSIKEITNESVILYVEDNLPNIELVDEIISEHRPGLRLITTSQGLQTAIMARDYKPALILLDLDLPDIQGADVLDQLMNDDLTKHIPVIIVSADAMPYQIEKLINSGAKDYLTKPLDIARFLKIIDNYIIP